MKHYKTERIQLGKAGMFLDNMDNIRAGTLDVKILVCPECRRLEFFLDDDKFTEEYSDGADDTIEQVVCPECACIHDMDYPKCPNCGYDYYN